MDRMQQGNPEMLNAVIHPVKKSKPDISLVNIDGGSGVTKLIEEIISHHRFSVYKYVWQIQWHNIFPKLSLSSITKTRCGCLKRGLRNLGEEVIALQ